MAKRKSKPQKSQAISIILAIIIVACYFVYTKVIAPTQDGELPKGQISFHFMTLGNGSSGDSIYVRAGENDILIDGGSTQGSIEYITDYVDDFVTDRKLEYVIVTHGDNDHIAGFSKINGSLFDYYECETIIDFPKTSKTTQAYANYLSERNDEIDLGANHYTALDCYNNQNGGQREYDLSGDGNIKLQILYNYFYDHTRSGGVENDYSVCVQFVHGNKKFLFTGDLESKGEEYLVEYNDLSKVALYKAGHHGSATSTSIALMSVIQPEICVVTCAIGDKHDFPRQEFINNIAPYTSKVYVTTMANENYTGGADFVDMNGNVVVVSDETEGVYVRCSNNDTVLKDTLWMQQNRYLPPKWQEE